MTLRQDIFEAAVGRTGSWSQADLITDDIMAVINRAPVGVWAEAQAERDRAHLLHGDASMESAPPLDLIRLTILMEEVGEVAREFNEARIKVAGTDNEPIPDRAALRKELIQCTAMAGAWAEALGGVR